ncbi:MAG: OsmC family peroxiredoxin [Gemmatimonadetes bacterium]|nr:OsmC family peroxiredoxin [Gemmatimonadota bacterium]
MPVRTAEAEWKGNLNQGTGRMRTETGSYEGAYSFGSRFEEAKGTNPEELIAAAHAGCFSMAFSGQLSKAGFEPTSVQTTAKVNLVKGETGFSITRIDLVCRAQVPGVDEATFREKAEAAKNGCPISKALASVEITLDARLEK